MESFFAKKTVQGNLLKLELIGTIDGSVSLSKIVGNEPHPEVEVNAQKLTMVNSIGIKEWISYFSELRSKGVKLRFINCSEPIVALINIISNFIERSEVGSILVPYVCEKCGIDFRHPMEVKREKYETLTPPAAQCPKCNQPATFDDAVDEYFNFLLRNKK